jgi:hypothetical protein
VVDGARDAPERRARWPWQDWERGGRRELVAAGKESERMMAKGVERTREGRAPFIGRDGALGRRYWPASEDKRASFNGVHGGFNRTV